MPAPLQSAVVASVVRATSAAMRPVTVVVIDEHLKDPLKVLLVEDRRPNRNTLSGPCSEPFGNAVGLRRYAQGPIDFVWLPSRAELDSSSCTLQAA